MPKTKKPATVGIRRVRTKEDRKRPSVFMRLKVDEAFKGIALFEPDPELEDNPGYFEYYDHYDKQANQYVPCAGEACPFCAANDNPSTRALTAWFFPDAGDKKDQVKIFTMNYSTINDTSDESEDEGGILGKLLRIKRLSDRGDYKVKVTGKKLSAKELKAAMKLLTEKLAEIGGKDKSLEGVVLRQLAAQLERLKAMSALDDDDNDDDDDDDEETTTTSSKSRKGTATKDADEDETDDDDDEDEDEEEESGDVTEIEGVEYEVVKVNEKDEIFDLKNADEKVKMWLGEGVEVDYDEVKKGVTVTVDAAQDDEGDWIITGLSVKAAKSGKKAGGKKKK